MTLSPEHALSFGPVNISLAPNRIRPAGGGHHGVGIRHARRLAALPGAFAARVVATLGVKQEDVLRARARRALVRLAELNPQNLANTARTFA